MAAQEADQPFDYCDVVTTTTHKSLRGPRAGMIFSRKVGPHCSTVIAVLASPALFIRALMWLHCMTFHLVAHGFTKSMRCCQIFPFCCGCFVLIRKPLFVGYLKLFWARSGYYLSLMLLWHQIRCSRGSVRKSHKSGQATLQLGLHVAMALDEVLRGFVLATHKAGTNV